MSNGDIDRSMRVLVVGLDRLTARAVRADFPHARVAAARTLDSRAGRRRGADPHLVVINGAQSDPAAERAAIWRRWGDAVVVTELHGRQPIARVWRTSRVVESVEIGPGFLTPFLPRVLSQPQPAARPLATLRMIGYVAILWNLTIGVHLMHLSLGAVALTMFGFAVLVMDLVYRAQRDRRVAHHH